MTGSMLCGDSMLSEVAVSLNSIFSSFAAGMQELGVNLIPDAFLLRFCGFDCSLQLLDVRTL